ncbi:MAG TPA: hypothetical protein VEF92_04185 [Burkholderiales bacterium]|nr:hypothetical protein [Burkholderiales bacterium]
MKNFPGLFIAAVLALASAAAGAQAPTPVRGTVTGLEGNALSVKTREGKDVKIHLADKFRVSAVKAITLADIKPGDFVGPASRKRADGSLEAISLQLFPAALRGVIPEGHGPWDLEPGSLMTNSTVAKIAQVPSGRELTLEYPGGTQKVFVPEGVPMFTTVPGDRSLLVPGATIFAMARPGPGGQLAAAGVTVSKDGVKPAN